MSQKKGMDPQQLYDILRPLQEKQGYFFNKDHTMTMAILEQMLVTKARYGYMACPCRLANGTYEADKDILCPCIYRADDVREYGACFCGLYVSGDWNESKTPHDTYVPDRRPGSKILR